MKVVASVSVKETSDLDAVIKKIEASAGKAPKGVRVGLPKGSDGGVLDIALYNHFGTSRGIPPRPFITIGIAKKRGEIRASLRQIAKSVVEGKYDLGTGMEKLGQLGQQAIQDQIGSNMPPPNSPATVKAKGSSKTLIDTGRMRASITFQVED